MIIYRFKRWFFLWGMYSNCLHVSAGSLTFGQLVVLLSYFGVGFTETLATDVYFQWIVYWNNVTGNLISVKSLWTTLDQIPYF